MPIEAADCKPFLRVLSAAVGLALLALSCAGFNHLGKTSGALEGQASFGCMCFLGLMFGLLLFLGESKSEHFFFFFGFMRYRIGRAVVFTLAGIMTVIMGKNMNDACRCASYTLLIIEGVACLACAALQILAVFTFSNNTSSTASTSSRQAAHAPSLPQPVVAASPTTESTYVPPTPSKPATKKASAASSSASHDDGNMPSWMRV